MYAAITADVIGSTDLVRDTGRPVVPVLKRALKSVNERWTHALAVPFDISAGDECQGLVSDLSAAFEVLYDLRLEMAPLKLRAGIGVGAISVPLALSTREMEGECFLRAREALERLDKRSVTGFVMGGGAVEAAIQASLHLVDVALGRWRASQWATVKAVRDAASQAEAAQAIGIAAPTLNKHYARSNWRCIEQALRAAGALLIQQLALSEKG